MESVTSGASLDAAGLANPQSPSTVEEATRLASLLERLDDFGKRLDVSLARRSENEAAIKELEQMLKEQRAVNSAGANSKKVRWEPDPQILSRRSSIGRSSIISNMSLVPMENTKSSYHGRVA